MLSVLLFRAAVAAGCPEPVTLEALDGQLGAAEAAFLAMDAAAFVTQLGVLEADIACVAVALPPDRAARLHTIQAISAFLARDEQRTVSAFQAADSATPGADLIAWLPEGHPVRTELRYARRFDVPPAAALDAPAGTVLVGGQPANGLVLSWPAVLQRSADGQITETVLYQPSTPLPDWAALAPQPISPEHRRRIVLGSATAASAASAALLLALSADSYTRFSGNIPYGEMDAVQARANISASAGIGAAVLTAGLGTALVITW